MHDCVTQQVFQRGHDGFEYLTVEEILGTLERQVDELALLFGRLPDDAREPRCLPVERNHASLHETVLKLGRHARLLRQQRIGLGRQAVQ